MRTLTLIGAALSLGCGAESVEERAQVSGFVDFDGFEAVPVAIEASSDDGRVVRAALIDAAFTLELPVATLWSLRVEVADGKEHPIALARGGYFDRALVVQDAVSVTLAQVWLPPPGFELSACESECVVIETIAHCADGPTPRLENASAVLLGTGTLGDLPGAARGTRYALSTRVPAPILSRCAAATAP